MLWLVFSVHIHVGLNEGSDHEMEEAHCRFGRGVVGWLSMAYKATEYALHVKILQTQSDYDASRFSIRRNVIQGLLDYWIVCL
jgi:hypothetical protein